MAELLLGEEIDPAARHAQRHQGGAPHRRLHHPRRDRRHDRLGQDRPRRGARGGGAARRRPVPAHRPQGRPHQPLPHVPEPGAGRLRALGQRRATPRRTARASTSSPPPRPRRGPRAWRGWGARRRRASARCAPTVDLTIYTPGSNGGVAAEPRRLAAGARPTWTTPRSSATRSRASCRACSASSASTPTRCRAASTSCCPTSSTTSWQQGRSPRPARRWSGMVPQPADPQARRVRPRHVLPAEGPHCSWPCGSTACWRRRASRRGSQGVPLDIDAMLRTPDGKPACAIVTHRPPVRRGAPVRAEPRPVEARHVDAPPVGHHRPAGAAVHGRGGRLPAAHGRAADEEADHDADEAGPRLRRRRRAGHPEPRRHRLQGASPTPAPG